MFSKRLRRASLLGILAVFANRSDALAQHNHDDMRRPGVFRFGAQGIGVVTRMTPAVNGRDMTEAYFTQPIITAHASLLGGAISFQGMLNLEGWTMPDGELNSAIWGEGFVDKRHPHTYAHEALVTITQNFGRIGASLTAGKGFPPFGTDDPMVRPFVKYPANHHLAQIPERLVTVGAVRYGPLSLEAGTFNGDEPLNPKSNGTLGRFGDSWAARATLTPVRGVELQGSHAYVESPEIPSGGGMDQQKLDVSARFDREVRGTRYYALAEYARTGFFSLGTERFAVPSKLVEASATRAGWLVGARYERTVRPEEERLLQGFPFRSLRPATDFSILGRTRWDIATVQLARGFAHPYGTVQPLIEISRSRAETVNKPAVYEPGQFYGDDVIWMASFGIRVTTGLRHTSMGRYGAALERAN